MKRVNCHQRNDWKRKVEEIGFGYHTIDGTYWDESAYYEFSMSEVNILEKATSELFERCLEAVQYIIDNKLYELFKIDPRFIPLIESSWNNEVPSIYARFDLAYDGINPPKMLEFNADTPTSLFEAGVVQWYWLEDVMPGADQFNSVHDKLINYWQYLKPFLKPGKLHFACLKDNIEDLTTVEYLRDCAMQAGLSTEFIYIEDLGWDDQNLSFVDMNNENISNIFKLYPWEWLIRDDFGKNLLSCQNPPFWIEPAWKMLLSNKAILPILWKLFPNHPNLLASYFDDAEIGFNYVKKPLLSREGANISIFKNGFLLESSEGEYGDEGFIYQQYCDLPVFGDNHPVLGSWLIGLEPAGIGIRESKNLITDNLSRFVPQIIR